MYSSAKEVVSQRQTVTFAQREGPTERTAFSLHFPIYHVTALTISRFVCEGLHSCLTAIVTLVKTFWCLHESNNHLQLYLSRHTSWQLNNRGRKNHLNRSEEGKKTTEITLEYLSCLCLMWKTFVLREGKYTDHLKKLPAFFLESRWLSTYVFYCIISNGSLNICFHKWG